MGVTGGRLADVCDAEALSELMLGLSGVGDGEAVSWSHAAWLASFISFIVATASALELNQGIDYDAAQTLGATFGAQCSTHIDTHAHAHAHICETQPNKTTHLFVKCVRACFLFTNTPNFRRFRCDADAESRFRSRAKHVSRVSYGLFTLKYTTQNAICGRNFRTMPTHLVRNFFPHTHTHKRTQIALLYNADGDSDSEYRWWTTIRIGEWTDHDVNRAARLMLWWST